MKALVYKGPKVLEFEDVPEPRPNEGEVVIQIESVGICGSDMHAYLGHDERRPAPLILGHEAAGKVISGAQPGRRVTINPLVTCTKCAACLEGRENLCADRQIISMPPREGAFAQFVAMPVRNLVDVPDHINLDEAALAEPLACGWHAVRIAKEKLHGPLTEAKALVIGGGAIGVGAALSLMARGVKNITLVEQNERRVSYLRALDEFSVVSTKDLPDGSKFDLVIDCVGMGGTRLLASQIVRPGGLIVNIGLGDNLEGLDIRRLTLQEIGYVGTYTYTQNDFRETAQAIFEGRLGRLTWTEKMPLANGAAAFSDILAGKTLAPKIILKP